MKAFSKIQSSLVCHIWLSNQYNRLIMPVLSDNKEPIDRDRAEYQVNNFRLKMTYIYLSCAKVLYMATHSLCQLLIRAMIFSSSLNLLERKTLTTIWCLKLIHLTCSLLFLRSEGLPQRCLYMKVFWTYAAKLQEITLAEMWFP